MPRKIIGIPTSLVLGGVLAAILPVAYTPVAHAADWTETAVLNGDHQEPALSTTAAVTRAAPPDQWSGASVQTFSAPLAQHPDGYQATSLNYNASNGGAGTLRTRLWGVHKNSQVRVTFDHSPSTLASCTPEEVAEGQRFKVSAYKEVERNEDGSPVTGPGNQIVREEVASAEYQTLGTTKSPNAVGSPAWTTGDDVPAFEFTAEEDNPIVIWESLEVNATADRACGPVITHVRAQEQAADPNHRVEQNQMPWNAYRGHDEVALTTALTTCTAKDRCTFTIDPRYSYQYFAKTRILGHADINCTRNTKMDKRDLVYTEEGFDSITQEINRVANQKQIDQNLDNTGVGDVRPPNLNELHPNMFQQAAAGFQRWDGNPNLVNTTNPLTPSRETRKQVEHAVQPHEASWFEVQAARERFEGMFAGGTWPNNITIQATFDYPSNKVPDRLYQRTGPMTLAEQAHCGTDRPSRVTPDNGGVRSLSPGTGDTAGTSAAESGLIQVPVTPRTRDTKITPVSTTTSAER